MKAAKEPRWELLPTEEYPADEHGDDGEEAAKDRSKAGADAPHQSHIGWGARAFRQCMLAGMGLFCESYFVFTTGQVSGVWELQYPECWLKGKDATCSSNAQCDGFFPNVPKSKIQSDPDVKCDNLDCSELVRFLPTSVVLVGIMCGMLVFAYYIDRIGRRLGSVIVSLFMLVGAVLMVTAPNLGDVQGLFIFFSLAFTLFGFGLGGEFPTSSVSATENAEAAVSGSHRGSYVVSVFSMQAVGALVGSAVMWAVMILTRSTDADCTDPHANAFGYNPSQLSIAWRSLYAVGTALTAFTVYYRLRFVRETPTYASAAADDARELSLLDKLRELNGMYRSRLVGTAVGWFLWDVCFYGNRLSISQILDDILGKQHGPNGLKQKFMFFSNMLAYIGLLSAVLGIERIGRRALQTGGFVIIAAAFLLITACFDFLHRHFYVLYALYCVSVFFGQFGPNATTYVIPAETFPTELRALAHGISAFVGKMGALAGSVLFKWLSNRKTLMAATATRYIFGISGVVSIMGAMLSALCVVELSGTPLKKVDEWHRLRKRDIIAEEQPLSIWEKSRLGQAASR